MKHIVTTYQRTTKCAKPNGWRIWEAYHSNRNDWLHNVKAADGSFGKLPSFPMSWPKICVYALEEYK